MEARVSVLRASSDMAMIARPSASSSHEAASHSHPLRCPLHRLLTFTFLKVDLCGQQKKALKFCLVRANSSDKEFANPIGPFQPRSPTGLYLAELLYSNPDLIPAAVEHELEVLAENREADSSQNQLVLSGADLLLYKRIAELKSQERFDALEEILYTLIVQKFVEARIAMVPSIPVLMSGDMSSWPLQFKELESVHSVEALELILEHSLLVLGKQRATKYFSSSMFAHMSKKSMKEIYTDSVNYGYFMRRLHNRFQLEKTMKLYPFATSSSGVGDKEIAAAMSILRDLRGSSQTSSATQLKTSEFLAYILLFDTEALRGFLTVRSKESRSIVDKHTQALFKGIDFRIASDGSMREDGKEDGSQLNFLRSKGLILEAVAFGTFLWDVETYVDSYYSLVTS